MGARTAAWRAAFLLAVACTTTHAGEPSWADVLTREAAARPGMDERGAPRATGLPLKYCSHCNAKLVERRCDAAAQTYLLLRYLAALRRFLRGDHADRDALRCSGPTQESCNVTGNWARKSCMRRVCHESHLAGHLAPAAARTARTRAASDAALAAAQADAVTRLEPKLRLGGAFFLGSDYLDFLVYNLFFPNVKRGVYAEAGAINGVDESNTYVFERFLEWRGLLVEPTSCAVCELPANRPNATIFHGAICPPEARSDTFDSATMDVFCARSPELAGAEARRCERAVAGAPKVVPCRTLTEIFEAAGLSRVHFFSLDVEDFVHQALASLDLDRVDVDVLLVEVRADADVDVLRRAGYATFALTQQDDGYRGFLADLLAWKPPRFGGACARLDRSAAALEAELDGAWVDPWGR